MWVRFVNSIKDMHDKGIILHSNLRRKLNNGVSIKFWLDVWIGDSFLSTRFPRLFRLDSDPDCFVRDRWINGSWSWSWSMPIIGGSLISQLQAIYDLLHSSHISENSHDVWEWSIGDTNSFSVKGTRVHIDNFILPDVHTPTRWIRYIPKKVNIMVWRALRDRLPTRWNLSRKGIDIVSLLCPICNQNPELIDHVLWKCSLASELWHKVFMWLDLTPPVINSFAAIFDWVEDLRINPQGKHIVQSILGVTAWSIWKFRNGCIFDHKRPIRQDIFDNIVDLSYVWLSNRYRKLNISWTNWIQNPLLVPCL
ncbi:RNA-directed DNA polymerase, eukaryota [Tanacetum coccineum]